MAGRGAGARGCRLPKDANIHAREHQSTTRWSKAANRRGSLCNAFKRRNLSCSQVRQAERNCRLAGAKTAPANLHFGRSEYGGWADRDEERSGVKGQTGDSSSHVAPRDTRENENSRNCGIAESSIYGYLQESYPIPKAGVGSSPRFATARAARGAFWSELSNSKGGGPKAGF